MKARLNIAETDEGWSITYGYGAITGPFHDEFNDIEYLLKFVREYFEREQPNET